MRKKICTSCKAEKLESEFHRFGKDGSRLGKWCEDCYTKKIAGKPPATPKTTSSRPV